MEGRCQGLALCPFAERGIDDHAAIRAQKGFRLENQLRIGPLGVRVGIELRAASVARAEAGDALSHLVGAHAT